LLPYGPQFLWRDRFDHHALKFSLEDRAQITPLWIEDFDHRSGVTDKIDNKSRQ
jgi:hypothetical protein